MRSPGEIRQKLKQAQFRHVKKFLRSRFPGQHWNQGEVELAKIEIKESFQSPIHVVAQEFPDVAALRWVLEDADDNGEFVAGSTLVGSLDGVLLWADTEKEASHARTLLDSFAAASQKKSWWRSIFS